MKREQRSWISLATFFFTACVVPDPPPTIDDPQGGGACLREDSAGCGELGSCRFQAGADHCACRAGYTEDGDDCTAHCPDAEPAHEPTVVRYVGPSGVDRPECAGGTRDDPWASIVEPSRAGCLTAGTDVILLEGEYSADELFDGGLKVIATADQPIRIIGDPTSASPYPPRISGQISIASRNVELRRLEVVQTPGANGVMIAGEGITVRDSWIHGAGGFGGEDCIKILSQGVLGAEEVRTVGVRILDNRIEDCTEDAIDVTGARDVVYRGNYIARAKLIQIKGGTEDILVEMNHITDLEFGIVGFSMACATYCGSPLQPLLPVERRFVARNVTIRNNRIERIQRAAIIGSGWADAQVVHNTFTEIGGSVVSLQREGFDFVDELALTWCDGDNECEGCMAAGGACDRITFAARGFIFENNVVSGTGLPAVSVLPSSEQVSFRNNVFATDGQFLIGDDRYELSGFPLDTDSRVSDPRLDSQLRLLAGSPALDTATDLRLCADALGTMRDSSPDVGAIEGAF